MLQHIAKQQMPVKAYRIEIMFILSGLPIMHRKRDLEMAPGYWTIGLKMKNSLEAVIRTLTLI